MIPVPTVRLALLAAGSAGVALLLPVPLAVGLVVLNGTLAVAGLGDALVAPGRRHLTVHRQGTGDLLVEVPAEMAWRIRNGGGRSAHVEFADTVAPSFGAVRRVAAVVPPRSEAEVRVAILPRRRGRHRLDRLAVRSRGPLGLAARQWTVSDAVEVRVVPRLRARDLVEQAVAAARRMDMGEKRPVAVGGATEFDSLREYTRDDEYRRIDWAATARRGRPIVRTYRTPQHQSVVAMLDTGRVMATSVDGSPRLEHAIEGVLVLSTLATRLGDRVGLVTFDRRVQHVVAPASGARHIRALTEGLFDVEPSLVESDHRAAMRQTLAGISRRSLVVLFTDLVEGVVEDSLAPALPVVRARHLLVVAATHEAPAATSTAGPADADAVRRAVAEERLAERRARSAALLAASGADVVDVPAPRFARSIVDTYLSIKATGRL